MATSEATFPTPALLMDDMPPGLEMHRLRRRLLQLLAVVVVLAILLMLIPGLAEVRHRLARASMAWLAPAVSLEVLSCLAYVVAFRAAFCARMTWRMSYRMGMSSLGAAALLPVGGAGGLALGAWALRRGGLPVERIARRTVAFFALTSAVNVLAVIIAGVALALRIVPGPHGALLTLLPAGVAAAAVLSVLAIPRLAARIAPRWSSEERSNVSRAVAGALDAIGDGVQEALGLLRARDGRLLGGAIGYLAFDIAVFWASFRAFGAAPPLAGLLLAYLLGQLGSLIPIPGGIGGVEAGLVGALVLYGTPVAQATVGVILYRAVLLITPATLGGLAFVQLKRSLRDHAAARIPCADDLPPVATARSS